MPVFRRRRGERHELSGTALSEADRVWSRAAMERGGTQPREGDVALASLLSLHSLAMNGGLLHAIERHTDDEIEQAVSGFRYFGLNDAAEVVVSIAQQAGRVDVADLDAVEQLEVEADDRYAEALPDDSTLVVRFEHEFRLHPDAFTPLR